MVMITITQEEESLNCFYKRNCVELEGMYSCRFRLDHYQMLAKLAFTTNIITTLTISIITITLTTNITTTLTISIKTSLREGICSRLTSWSCDRRCSGIPTLERNIVAMAGDHIVAARCRLLSFLLSP